MTNDNPVPVTDWPVTDDWEQPVDPCWRGYAPYRDTDPRVALVLQDVIDDPSFGHWIRNDPEVDLLTARINREDDLPSRRWLCIRRWQLIADEAERREQERKR